MLVLTGIMVSLAVVLTSARRARLGDVIAGTVVARRKSRPAMGAPAAAAAAAAGAAATAEPAAAGALSPSGPVRDAATASRAAELVAVAQAVLRAPPAPADQPAAAGQPAAADQPAPESGGGRVPWRWRRTVAGLLVAFAPEWILTLVAVFFMGAVRDSAPTNGDAVFIAVSTVVFDGWWVGWAWGFSLRRFGLPFSAWGFRRPSRSIFWVVPLALVISLLVDALWAQVVTAPVPQDFPRSALGMVLSAVVACLLAPLFEETFFRGFFFQGLESSMGTVWAALLSAAVFAAIHLDLAGFVPLFTAGLLLTWTFRRTGSIWGSIALHAVYNGVAVLAWMFN